jgi:hypothetical protein
MFKSILVHGLIAGLIAGGFMFGMAVSMAGHPPPSLGMLLGYTSMLIAFSAVFAAVKRHRDRELGGVIGFWPAFGMGLGIVLIGSVLYVAAWEAAMAVTQMDFIGEYSKAVLAEKKAGGASAEELAKMAAELEAFGKQYTQPVFRMSMTFLEIFPVGFLVALVSAALLRNRRVLATRVAAAA